MARQWRSLNSRLGPESVGSRYLFRWVARRMLPLHSHIATPLFLSHLQGICRRLRCTAPGPGTPLTTLREVLSIRGVSVPSLEEELDKLLGLHFSSQRDPTGHNSVRPEGCAVPRTRSRQSAPGKLHYCLPAHTPTTCCACCHPPSTTKKTLDTSLRMHWWAIFDLGPDGSSSQASLPSPAQIPTTIRLDEVIPISPAPVSRFLSDARARPVPTTNTSP
ncbi:hypothetical protein CCHR01_05602 [Colletotrichum chrysophilum]|uniref:Uncharacterized protein n=1 Tax=Colletotrichum chrysophilum TaxID=1836956 RepID=A0AAD9EKD9_9PEZI|nr:hypothetical protein CCHR01_05602 [Colletotrichum chrysophilum]